MEDREKEEAEEVKKKINARPTSHLDTFKTVLVISITSIRRNYLKNNRAVICRKQISVEGNGHCCHRPSSNWETKPTQSSGELVTVENI